MATNFTQRIEAAFAVEDSRNCIESIKQTVVAELLALDPRVHLKTTEYFNHSYIPDLVATWPDDPSARERYVYLKYNTELGYLFDDLSLVRDHGPILFGMGQTPRNDAVSASRLDEASRETGTLVTDAPGVEALIGSSATKFFRLVGSAVTQGGRGLLDEAVATGALSALNRGFDGARRIDGQLTRGAADVAETIFDETHADRIIRLLQAVWIGSGGSLGDFPGKQSLTAGIADDALQFLLEFESVHDKDFWLRVGQHVSIAQLCRLRLPGGSPNLDHLMWTNASRYLAKACRVRSEEPMLSDSVESGWRWFVERELVGLIGHSCSAYLSDRIEDIDRVPPTRSQGLSHADLSRRARGLVLSELELWSAGRVLKYLSEDGANVLDDPALVLLEQSLGRETLIRKAGVALRDGRSLSCDLVTATAAGKTSSRIGLPSLLLSSLKLFAAVEPDEYEALRTRLTPPLDSDEDMLPVDEFEGDRRRG